MYASALAAADAAADDDADDGAAEVVLLVLRLGLGLMKRHSNESAEALSRLMDDVVLRADRRQSAEGDDVQKSTALVPEALCTAQCSVPSSSSDARRASSASSSAPSRDDDDDGHDDDGHDDDGHDDDDDGGASSWTMSRGIEHVTVREQSGGR